MGLFNCIIEATAGNDTSYYFATVEDDGFTYFNDNRFFRFQTPDNIHDLETAGQQITISSGLQLWYVVRDVWVYVNLFDTLTLEMITGSDIDKQDLQNGLDTIVGYINQLGQMGIRDNGDVLLDLYRAVDQIVTDLSNQGISVTRPPAVSIWNSWTDKPNYTLI